MVQEVSGAFAATEVSDTFTSTASAVLASALTCAESGEDSLAAAIKATATLYASVAEGGADTAYFDSQAEVNAYLAAIEEVDALEALVNSSMAGSLQATEGPGTASLSAATTIEGQLAATELNDTFFAAAYMSNILLRCVSLQARATPCGVAGFNQATGVGAVMQSTGATTKPSNLSVTGQAQILNVESRTCRQ